MLVFLQRSLVSLACLGLLSACGGDEISFDETFTVTSMSHVEIGSQTFQQRDLALDGEVPEEDDSRYVYKNRLSDVDNSTEVIFTSVKGNSSQTEDLVISTIIDINDRYSALSVDDVTVKVNGANYTGDYVLIQEKSTGNLYPVVSGGMPFLSSYMTDDAYWYSLHRTANIADQDRIYFNDSDDKALYIFELSGGLFNFLELFSYHAKSVWINEYGDILSQDISDADTMTWFERSTSESVQGSSLAGYTPFLSEGIFYAKNTTDGKIYSLNKTASSIAPLFEVSWESVASSYPPASNSAKRGDYEMASDCKVYKLDVSNQYDKSITYLGDFSASNGQIAVAGQDSLFCIHATSATEDALPIITKFNITTGGYNTFPTSEGTLLDAVKRFTVISDDQVMFSEPVSDSASFNEYYIDVENNSEETMAVTEASIIGLQTLSL